MLKVDYWGFLLHVLKSIFLVFPPMGVILIEEQFIQWHVALSHVILIHYMPAIMTAVAIYMVIMVIVFNRHWRMSGRTVGRLFHLIVGWILALLTSWFLLILGACTTSEEQGNNANHDYAQMNINHRIGGTRRWNITHSIRYLSLNFRLGRLIFRGFFFLVGLIPWLNRAENTNLRRWIARGLALFVILWRCWEIPGLLFH